MSDQYTIMPTASSTLVFSVDNRRIVSGLRGVNTYPVVVGKYANHFPLLLLIEFHPGGLYPFLPLEQHYLRNAGIDLTSLDSQLTQQIEQALLCASSIDMLIQKLNCIFLSRLEATTPNPTIQCAMNSIIGNKGLLRVREISQSLYYSEKHLNRLFQRHIGTGIKTFSRIVRINQILRMMDLSPPDFEQIISIGGYFDTAHFVHDFQSICNMTPGEYLKNKSVFYNEMFKLT